MIGLNHIMHTNKLKVKKYNSDHENTELDLFITEEQVEDIKDFNKKKPDIPNVTYINHLNVSPLKGEFTKPIDELEQCGLPSSARKLKPTVVTGKNTDIDDDHTTMTIKQIKLSKSTDSLDDVINDNQGEARQNNINKLVKQDNISPKSG